METLRKPAHDGRKDAPSQVLHVPRCCHDVDIVETTGLPVKGGLQRQRREQEGVFLTVEAFLFQHQGGHAIAQQGDAGVMRLGHDPEDVHDDLPWGLRAP